MVDQPALEVLEVLEVEFDLFEFSITLIDMDQGSYTNLWSFSLVGFQIILIAEKLKRGEEEAANTYRKCFLDDQKELIFLWIIWVHCSKPSEHFRIEVFRMEEIRRDCFLHREVIGNSPF